MELDEALDIQGLNLPMGTQVGNDLRIKIAAQRLMIREFLHMFNEFQKFGTGSVGGS